MVMAEEGGFHRFEWVTERMPGGDKLARSSAPNYDGEDSDQKLTQKSIKFLQEQKITHVISLNSLANDDDTIKKKLTDNSIAYTPLPVEDFHAPTAQQLSDGNAAYRKHRTGTLVWCGYGHGRTGTMITALQIYAEKDQGYQRQTLDHDDYEKNHVEQYHTDGTGAKTSTGQFEVLDALQR